MNRLTSIKSLPLVAAMLAVIAGASMAAEPGPGGLRQRPFGPAQGMPESVRPSRAPSPLPGSQPPAGEHHRPDSMSIRYRGTSYLVSGGRWYERRGDELVAVEPPAGVLVEELPKGYSMRWIGGAPYFYADGLYYVWRERLRRYEIMQNAPLDEPARPHEVRPDTSHDQAAAP